MVESVAAPRRWPRSVNAMLAVALLGLCIAGLLSVLGHPFTGMRAPSYVLAWLFGALGCNRALASAQDFVRPGTRRTALRLGKWLLVWFLPLPPILLVEAQVLERQRGWSARELAPVIAHADALATGAFTAETAPPVSFPVPVRLAETNDGYVLWLHAAALDIDGYTVAYDSSSRRWTQTHNDRADAATLPVARCTLERAAWRCAEVERPPEARNAIPD